MNALRIIRTGRAFTICALVVDGKCQVEQFLDEMDRQNPLGKARIMAAIEIVSNQGTGHLQKQLLRSLGDGCFELKERGGLTRLFCFVDPSRNAVIICRNAWKKKEGKAQDEQIKALRKFRTAYLGRPWDFESEKRT